MKPEYLLTDLDVPKSFFAQVSHVAATTAAKAKVVDNSSNIIQAGNL